MVLKFCVPPSGIFKGGGAKGVEAPPPWMLEEVSWDFFLVHPIFVA